jgi:hypothetical protein
MNSFEYQEFPHSLRNRATGNVYHLEKRLGSGSFGNVYDVGDGKILKSIRGVSGQSFLNEAKLQKKLYQKEPGVCPDLFEYGIEKNTAIYIIVMEKFDGTVRDLLEKEPTACLEFLKQIAVIFQRLEKYQFNHRDFKSDNAMYKIEADGKRRYALIDFGFSCATIDGRTYRGTGFFPSTAKCFRRSRDLAQCVYEIEHYTRTLPEDLRVFLRLLLTFDINGKTCRMYKGCPPYKINTWRDTYGFLDNDEIENPHTTPEGMLHALEVYQKHGIQACKNGFVVDPVVDVCVPKPDTIPQPILDKPESPKQQDCPPGKIRNPKTRRCVKKTGAIGRNIQVDDCPPGKIRNPKTRRCVKKDGAIGRNL